VIRFSAILVAGALAVLVAGVLATSLALVYLSIGVSVLALVLLAIGLILQRREIFGETGAAAVGGQPAWPVTPVTGTPVMVGGRARIPEPGLSPEEPGRQPAEAEAGSGNGSSGGQAGRDVPAEIRWAWQEQEGSSEVGPARAPQARTGPGRNGTGQDGPVKGGPARPARTGGYSRTHGSGQGRPPTAPPGRPPPAATAPRGGEAAANGAADSGPGPRPDQPGHGTRPDQRAAGTAPPGRGAAPSGRPPVGAGPPEWPVAGITWQEPADARRPSREPDTREPDTREPDTREPDGGWVFTPPTPPPPDVPASPAEEPDVRAPGPGGPEADITQQETAHGQWPARRPEDRAAALPTPPDRPLSPSGPDRPASPKDDFWDRVNDELAADAQREPDTPPRAASAGPPPPAAGGDLWSRPADRRADEVAGAGSSTGEPGQGRSGASERWNPWTPNVSGRPDSPAAHDEVESRDRADEGAAGEGAKAGTLGPLFAWRDAAADHAGAAGTGKEPGTADKEPAADVKEPAGAGREPTGAGKEPADVEKEPADVEKEADVKAEEADEEEEAAPSPWSIPLTLVGDVSDLDEEDDGRPAGPGAVGDTGKPPEAGEKSAPGRWGSDIWARPSWARAEEQQAGPAKADSDDGPGKPDEADRAGAGAGRGPWLTRPGKSATAGWAGRDAGDQADAADERAGADDDATAGRTARWADPLPRRVGRDDLPTRVGRDDLPTRAGRDDLTRRAGRDEAATSTGSEAVADDHAKATSVGRDDVTTLAGRDDVATRAARDDAAIPAGRGDADIDASRDGGADDHAEATYAGRDGGDRATAEPTAGRIGSGADALPTRVGRDDVGRHAGGDAGASDRVKATPADRDADTDDGPVASHSDRDDAADDKAKAAGAGEGDGDAKPPSATPAEKPAPAGRPSATLFQPPISTAAGATPGSSADPVTGKAAGPATQREAASPAEGAGGRAPGAGSGVGKPGPGPAPARDGDERGATEQGGAGRNGPARAAEGNAVVIVPGIARYHRAGCILIRFLGSDDLETATAQEAEAKGCAPCRACEPDKPLSSGD